MVLATQGRVLRLKEKIGARNQTFAICRGQCLAYARFEVMPSLVRRVDASEARPKREINEGRGVVLFPGCAVEKSRDSRGCLG
jgi:hypothetical protein